MTTGFEDEDGDISDGDGIGDSVGDGTGDSVGDGTGDDHDNSGSIICLLYYTCSI